MMSVMDYPDVAVIIPVLNRPQNVEPLAQSLFDSCPEATPYFITTFSDTKEIAAVRDAGYEPIITLEIGFGPKANLGYAKTSESWLLFIGDDVTFHPGWYQAALETAECTGSSLIGTNDLSDRAGIGQHAIHPLVRRSYIDTQGMSWDGPGTVTHPGYRHWYIDNEWSEKAVVDNVFAYSPKSIIEHHHYTNDPDVLDDTYELGGERRTADGRLFHRRLLEHTGQTIV